MGAHTDRSRHREAGDVAVLFALACPEAVLMMFTRERAALVDHRAGVADPAGSGLAPLAGLRALCLGREEQAGASPFVSKVTN